jgi:hypothetical protein
VIAWVGKLGMRCCKCNSNENKLVCVPKGKVWRERGRTRERASESHVLLDLFPDDWRCLFNPHEVNHGGVHLNVTVEDFPESQSFKFTSHTTEESLRRLTNWS